MPAVHRDFTFAFFGERNSMDTIRLVVKRELDEARNNG